MTESKEKDTLMKFAEVFGNLIKEIVNEKLEANLREKLAEPKTSFEQVLEANRKLTEREK